MPKAAHSLSELSREWLQLQLYIIPFHAHPCNCTTALWDWAGKQQLWCRSEVDYNPIEYLLLCVLPSLCNTWGETQILCMHFLPLCCCCSTGERFVHWSPDFVWRSCLVKMTHVHCDQDHRSWLQYYIFASPCLSSISCQYAFVKCLVFTLLHGPAWVRSLGSE